MNLLPHKQFEIQTRMTLQDAVDALTWYVQTDRGIKGWLFSKKDFVGRITPGGFVIRRKIAYANSFRPVCRGKFDLTSEGARVRVTMTPSIFVIAVCCLLAASGFLAGFRSGSGANILSEIALLLLLYLVLLAAFYFEAAKAETFLRETLYP